MEVIIALGILAIFRFLYLRWREENYGLYDAGPEQQIENNDTDLQNHESWDSSWDHGGGMDWSTIDDPSTY